MEDYIHNLSFRVMNPLTEDELTSINLLLNSKLGILNMKYNKSIITIDYNPYLISEEAILNSLKRIEISSATNKKPGLFKQWVKEMEKSNKKNFGPHLDCCNMNKK